MAAPAEQKEEPVVFVPTATVVGNAFATQYYTILEQSPALVYRFYQDISKFGRPEDGGAMGYTTTMEAINRNILSYGSLRADIKFVDAQESYNGGVIVLVTGSMVNADNLRRGFTQTFFLAPQDKGYFVLNDIFRYVEDDFHQKPDAGIAPTTPSQDSLPVQENHISEQCNGEVYNPSENGEVVVEEEEVEEEEEEPVAEVVDEAPNELPVVAEVVDEAPNELPVVAKVVDEARNELPVVVESNAKVGETPKKSYASIVMKDTPAIASPANPSKSVPKMQEQQVPVAPVAAVAPPSSADMVDDGNNQEAEGGDGHSIYLKNLPVNASFTLVEEGFKKFGPIKSNGIQVRNNKGFCFGFVEFETASAARSAIEASPITIGGRAVVVEEKKSTGTRGNNRGRYPPGRGGGGGFRGEGGRGRGGGGGGYGGGGRGGGGYGHGRGENNKNDYGNRGNGNANGNGNGGGRGGFQNRCEREGYQRSDHTGNGGGRVNRGGGSGFAATTRAPRVSAEA